MSGRTQVNVSGYTVDDDVTLSDDLFNIATGATLVLLGLDSMTDDVIEGSGRVSVRGPTTINNGLTLSGSALFVDMYSITQNAGNLTLGQSATDAVTVRNIAGATWSLSGGANINTNGASEFVNLGLLDQTGGTSYISSPFYDRGGTIQIDGTMVFNAAPGHAERFIDDTIEGPGTFNLLNGQAVLDGSNISTELAELGSTSGYASARILGDVTVSSPIIEMGVLNLGAGSLLSLTNPDAIVSFGSEVVGGGELDIAGGSVTTYDTYLIGDVTFDNKGDTTFDGASVLGGETGTDLFVNAWKGDTVTIENSSGATWTDIGQFSSFAGGGSGDDVFLNDGTFIEKDGGAAFRINVVNNGLIEAGPQIGVGSQNGLSFVDDLTGTGAVDLGSGYANIDAAVGSGQILSFSAEPNGSSPTLFLNDPQGFDGAIAGFDLNGASDDQLIVNTLTWHFQEFVSNGDNTGGSLLFSNGSAETAIHLNGAYDASGFHAAVLGSQTTITYSS